MPRPGSEERERAKDQVPGDPIGCHDHPVLSRCLLDQDLGMFRTGQACNELGVCHRPVDSRMPPQIPEPPPREDRHPTRKAEFPGDIPAGSGEPDLFFDRPALVNPNRGKEEEMAASGLKKGNPLQVVDTRGLLESFQGG